MDELIRFAKAHKGQIKKLAKKVRRSAIEGGVVIETGFAVQIRG